MEATDVLTQAEAASALGLTTASMTAPALTRLDMLNSAVADQLDQLCGPVVRRTITSESHDGGGCQVWTRYQPVAAVTAVSEYRGTTETALTASSVASQPAQGFALYDEGKIVRRNGDSDALFPTGRRNVLVTYSAGRFTHTTSSEDGFQTFKQAAALIVRDVWQSGNGMGTETFGGGDDAGAFVTLGPELLNRVKGLLHRHMEAPFV